MGIALKSTITTVLQTGGNTVHLGLSLDGISLEISGNTCLQLYSNICFSDTFVHCLYMAKFFAELLGCTLRDKGASPTLESQSQSRINQSQSTKRKTNFFRSLPSEKSLYDPVLERMPQTPTLVAMFDSSSFHRNLYQSKEESCSELYYQDNNLLSGSLEALIQHLVPNVDYYPDRTYIFTFLLSSRLFIHPSELMARVCHVCMEQQRLNEPGLDKMYRKNVQQIIQNLIRKLASLTQYEELITKINAQSTDRMTVLKTKPQSIQRDIITVCSDPYTVAQQLTHIELERLSYIGPEEFVQAFVQKDPLDNNENCYSDRKKPRNLEAYVEWFNRLSYLVATEICMPVKKKHRARMIEFFIDVARECFNIGNFNSLMAIISGMNMSPVSRLKKTWAKVKTAKFDILEHQMDPSSNFYNYRTALRGAAQRSLTAHSNREKIVIPFCSLLIKDIYFLNEGCTSRLPNGHVNFEKFWELAKQVSEFMTWKQVECPFEKDRKILHYVLTAPIFSEDALYLASYESEGPENHIEKDRWKTLRSALLGRA
uniref:Ras-GEF domain-containing family member 1B n=1 Tax=Xenopus tropicalis TaxID=8364 RepID=A0A6I8R9T9_XENTR